MHRGNKIALTIPAHNEERLIGPTLEGVPETVDRIYVVDDGSTDKTREIVQQYAAIDPRVELLVHEVNKGVGQAIITGYLQASADHYAENAARYAKGQRFFWQTLVSTSKLKDKSLEFARDSCGAGQKARP